MNIETDRALIPAYQAAIRFLTVAISAPRAESRHLPPSAHVARDARLVIAGPTGIDVGCVTNLPGETVEDPQGRKAEVHVRLGDLIAAQEMKVVLAVRCPAAPAGGRAAISLRLTDRDQALFPQPMAVDWTVVPAEVDTVQPVNTGVLIEVAAVVGQRARASALEALQDGDLPRASTLLKAAAEDLRALGAGIREVRGVADHLDAEHATLSGTLAPQ